MAALDKHHYIVRIALEKDGWTITDDPLMVLVGKRDMYIDLGAEKIIIAEKGVEQIAVEIKGFTQASTFYAFHEALGQYLNYWVALKASESKRVLYLAIPEKIYSKFEHDDLIPLSLKQFNVKLIIFNPQKEEIVKWIP